MIDFSALQRDAHALGEPFQGLLLHAQSLARQVLMGEHGRRDVGSGEEFWQYRPFENYTDTMRFVDWRRSAKSDELYVRQHEHKVSQTLMIWVDRDERMSSNKALKFSKFYHAAVMALALAILSDRSGEKLGDLSQVDVFGRGNKTIEALAKSLSQDGVGDIGQPRPKSVNLLMSDFLGAVEHIERFVSQAVDMGQYGVLCQVIAQDERDFPFRGRTIFQNMSSTEKHETQMAQDLRSDYLKRFAARQDFLSDLCRRSNWGFVQHVTSFPMLSGLQTLHTRLSKWGTL